MTFTFTKASKEQAKLRLALFGPSGSGKTFTALRLATGLGGKVALIDTERGSASKYADRFAFDALQLDTEHRDIKAYCQAIGVAQDAGYAVLIIDSLTHAWHELLQEVDKLARAKYGGNTWGAWSEGTPKQRSLVDAILDHDGHIIATMRTKTEWTTTTDNKGKVRPVRVGLAPEQGKGIEYEFDLLMELTPEHVARVLKDRTGKYQDKVIEMPGEKLGQELAAWLGQGEAPRPKQKPEPPPRANGTRPYAAEVVKRALEQRTKNDDGTPITEAQIGLVAGKLEECFAGHQHAQLKRYSVMSWLVGKESTKDLTKAEASAILNWILVSSSADDGGYYPLHVAAPAEAAAIVKASLLEAGQLPMDL